MGAWPLERVDSQGRDRMPAALADLRFRALVGREAWEALPEAVQRRFSKRLNGVAVALYQGRIINTQFSALGWLFAQSLRLLGAPLPICRDTDVPAVVCVSEDGGSGGQLWSRLYGKKRGFPQVIHSAKRFAGPTGLEEYIGRGIGMALHVECLPDGLRFISDQYFLMVAGRRLRLPRWLEPGRTVVEHLDRGAEGFVFSLALHHPLFGRLVEQQALFRDA